MFETIRGTSKRLQYSSNWNKLTAKLLCYSFHFCGAKSQKAVPTQYLLMEYPEKKKVVVSGMRSTEGVFQQQGGGASLKK